MAYGTVKVDNITFDNGGSDQNVTVSGLYNSLTSGITVTGTISGAVVIGSTSVSGTTVAGVTVTGTTVQGASGTFTSLTGTTIQGTTATFTSGIIASGTAAAPSLAILGDPDTGVFSPGADQLAVATSGTGRLFVDASGRLLVGTSASPSAGDGSASKFVVAGNAADINPESGAMSISRTGILFNSGDTIGSIAFTNPTGNAFAAISCAIDATPGVSDFPGRLTFSTTPDNSATLTERLRITSEGLVGVGVSSPQNLLHLRSDLSGATTQLYLMNRTSGASVESRIAFTTAENDLADNRHAYIGAVTTGAGENGNSFVIATNPTGDGAQTRVFVSSTGNVGINTTNPSQKLEVSGSTSIIGGGFLLMQNTNRVQWGSSNTASIAGQDGGSGYLALATAGAERARIDSSGRLLIGTSSAVAVRGITAGLELHALATTNGASASIARFAADAAGPQLNLGKSRSGTLSPGGIVQNNDTLGEISFCGDDGTDITSGAARIACEVDGTPGANDMPGRLVFSTTADGASSPTERMRIASTGAVGIGTSSPTYRLDVQGGQQRILNQGSTSALEIGTGTTTNQNALIDLVGDTTYSDYGLRIIRNSGGPNTSSELQHRGTGSLLLTAVDAGAIFFNTNNTARMSIDSGGNILIGQSTTTTPGLGNNTVGTCLDATGTGFFSRAAVGLRVNRTADGALVTFASAGTEEGNISISGSTTSYNGAHLSRWSQLSNNAERIEILRGSVLSNIDEMCEWGEEDNEQLNRMKVSDVEGDKNVSGVFQDWDDDDETYTDDFYCAMTGDFIIRIAEGVTVERGDLLMSAGDGTAKPQDDDIIRSKTIAKVTSTNVSCTYADGSYCVPCVLMAC
jgi:hypothetical protein